MLPTTLSWLPTTLSTLLLVCLAVSICQTSGDKETGRKQAIVEEMMVKGTAVVTGDTDNPNPEFSAALDKAYEPTEVAKRLIFPDNPPPRINMCEDKQPGQPYCRNDDGDPMIGDMCYCVGRGSHDDSCLLDGQDCCVASTRLCLDGRNPANQYQFDQACEGEGWTYKFGRCFKFTRTTAWVEQPYNWDRANQACASLTDHGRETENGRGAGLIAPKTANENEFVAAEIKKMVDLYHPGYVESVQVFIGLKFTIDNIIAVESHSGSCLPCIALKGWGYTKGWTYTNHRRHRPFLSAAYLRTGWTGAWQNDDDEQFGPSWGFPPHVTHNGVTEGTCPIMIVNISAGSNVWSAVSNTYELPDYWETDWYFQDKKRKFLACEKQPIQT